MATILGADPDLLDQLSSALSRAAQELRTMETRVGVAVQQSSWHGLDAEGFRAEWVSRGARLVVAAATQLESAAGVVTRNATEQRRTSAVDGGGGSGVPGAPGALPTTGQGSGSVLTPGGTSGLLFDRPGLGAGEVPPGPAGPLGPAGPGLPFGGAVLFPLPVPGPDIDPPQPLPPHQDIDPPQPLPPHQDIDPPQPLPPHQDIDPPQPPGSGPPFGGGPLFPGLTGAGVPRPAHPVPGLLPPFDRAAEGGPPAEPPTPGPEPAPAPADPPAPAPPPVSTPGPLDGPLEGAREVDVYDPVTGDRITDIDRIEQGRLIEEKSATMVLDPDIWIYDNVEGKVDDYLEARDHLPGYEDAPIVFDFTTPGVEPGFRDAVEAEVARQQELHPDVDISVQWPN